MSQDRRAKRKEFLETKTTFELREIVDLPVIVPLDEELSEIAAEILRERSDV